MAYYDDGYNWAQQHTTFYPEAYQDPVSFSSYETYGYLDTSYDASNVSVFDEAKCIDHGDYGYEYDYDYDYDYDYNYNSGHDYGECHNWYSSPNPSINYLEYNYVEPKLIAYQPIECDTGYVSYHTQFSVSYSEVDSGFNEPEFEEYDPTPYDGGYDIVSVYGKPLPPSDKTCYPRSKPKPKPIEPSPTPNVESQPKTKANNKLEPTPIAYPLPLPEPKPAPAPTLAPTPTPTPAPAPAPKSEREPIHDLVPVPDPIDLKEFGDRENAEYPYPGYGYDYPWPEYENANANATRVGYDYGYGKQVVQIPPCEYSPEVVDFCESIFGHWPCLARIRNQQMSIDNNPQMSCPETRYHNPLEECASYFFGRPIVSNNV